MRHELGFSFASNIPRSGMGIKGFPQVLQGLEKVFLAMREKNPVPRHFVVLVQGD
jgi:hypothetical protein